MNHEHEGGQPMSAVVTPPCIVCGQRSTIQLIGFREERGFKDWQRGMHIQRAFPDWPKDKAELLISGTHPACWKTLMNESGVEDDDGNVVAPPTEEEEFEAAALKEHQRDNERRLRDEHGRFVKES